MLENAFEGEESRASRYIVSALTIKVLTKNILIMLLTLAGVMGILGFLVSTTGS